MSKLSLDHDYQRKHRTATRTGAKRFAEQSRCPSCCRKSALRTMEVTGFVIITCRWCAYEDGWDIIPEGETE